MIPSFHGDDVGSKASAATADRGHSGPVTGMRRGALLLALLLMAAFLGRHFASEENGNPALTTGRDDSPAPWRNILLIVVDTLRRDHVSLYGDAVDTPNLERLAAGGQVFSAATSSFHQTTMSMAALFTGRTPSLEKSGGGTLEWTGQTWCGLSRMAEDDEDSCIPRNLPTLAERMQAAGFHTIGVVANELLYAPGGYERGFDRWVEVAPVERDEGNLFGNISRKVAVRRNAPAVNAELFRVLDGETDSGPLFMYVHYIDVHDYPILGLPYARMIHSLDTGVGELLDGLEARNLLSETLVILTSDHGETLDEEHALPSGRGHIGNPSFQPVLDVPLITSHPIGVASDTLVRSQDMFDFVLRLGRAEEAGPRDLSPDELFLTEIGFQTYRRGRWKSTRARKDGTISLFDLQTDPGETRDVAGQHPKIVAEHKTRIGELATQLAAETEGSGGLSPYDEERLRRLGYIE